MTSLADGWRRTGKGLLALCSDQKYLVVLSSPQKNMDVVMPADETWLTKRGHGMFSIDADILSRRHYDWCLKTTLRVR